jgi:superfamily I DNA and RNA helicase
MDPEKVLENLSLEDMLERAVDHKRESYQYIKKAARKIADVKLRESLIRQVIDERVSREQLKEIVDAIRLQRDLEKGIAD